MERQPAGPFALIIFIIVILVLLGLSNEKPSKHAAIAAAEPAIQVPAEAEPLKLPDPVPATYTFILDRRVANEYPNLWIIKRTNTGSGMTEIHVLKGPDYKVFIAHIVTGLHETPETK